MQSLPNLLAARLQHKALSVPALDIRMAAFTQFFARVIGAHPKVVRFVRLAFCVSLGPIAGPLAAMAMRRAAEGTPFLAALWASLIPLAWIDLAAATAYLAHKFHIT